MIATRPERCPSCGHKDKLTTVVSCITDEEFVECEMCKATFQEVVMLVPYERPAEPRDYLLERVNKLEQLVAALKAEAE